MEAVVQSLTLGHASEVKVVLASVVASLAVYQALLMVVGYGKLRVSFLRPAPASFSHRAIGDAVVVVTLVTTLLCIGYFGLEAEEHDSHPIVAALLLCVLAFKITVVRWFHSLGFLLPALGVTVLLLFIATWATVAAPYLG